MRGAEQQTKKGRSAAAARRQDNARDAPEASREDCCLQFLAGGHLAGIFRSSGGDLPWPRALTAEEREFGQFAYSKNTAVNTEEAKLSSEILVCDKMHSSVNDLDSNAELISYSLPR